MSAHPPDEVGQLSGAGVGVVDPPHHGVLEAHSPARRLLIPAHGLHQHLHGVGVVHRHHAAADVVVGGVEGDGEGELELLLGQLVDLRHEAAGGEADVPHPDVHALGGRDVLEKAHDFVEIIQRLPDAHQHDVGDALPDVLLGGVNFGADLPRLEVAHPARLGRGAEAAAHPAAHLGGHADRVAVVVAHDDGLDAVAVGHPQQVLHGAVLGLLPPLDDGRGDVKCLLELCQQGFGLVGHGRKVGHELLVDPVENLLGPEAGLAHRFQLRRQLFQRQGGYTAFSLHENLLLSGITFLHRAEEKAVHAGAGGDGKRTPVPHRHPGREADVRRHHPELRVSAHEGPHLLFVLGRVDGAGGVDQTPALFQVGGGCIQNGRLGGQ